MRYNNLAILATLVAFMFSDPGLGETHGGPTTNTPANPSTPPGSMDSSTGTSDKAKTGPTPPQHIYAWTNKPEGEGKRGGDTIADPNGNLERRDVKEQDSKPSKRLNRRLLYDDGDSERMAPRNKHFKTDVYRA